MMTKQRNRPISERFPKQRYGFVWSSVLLMVSCFAMRAQEPPKPATDPKQQRHDQLVTDTAKLLELANQLKSEVDKSSKDTLSVPVVKKADEVGKLAKKLREEMKPQT